MDFRILGPLEVTGDDGPLSLPGGHGQRALLLYLLLHANEVVPTERLIDALWPAEPPATAQKMVQVYVSQLRKSLGDRLVTRPPGYVLELRDGEVDAARAEALGREARGIAPDDALPLLEDALGSWRGEALLDVRYDDFAQPEIARLDELRLALVELRIDTELALGRDGELVPELERLVGEHPLRERFRAQLMTALYRSGRQGDALAAFQDARRVLLDELGLEPGDELRRLQRAILEHDSSLAAPRPLIERAFRHRRLIGLVGALLLAGAVTAAVIELTGGRTAAIPLRPNSIAALDPATLDVVAVVPVGERPTALIFAFDSLWVANGDDGTVMRVDPRTGRVLATIGIGSDEADLAAGYGSVWVADGNAGTLTRIDPAQNAVQRTIGFGRIDPLFPKPVFNVAIGTGGVWITRDTEVIRIDPSTNAVSERISTPSAATGIAAGGGRVWVTTANERILRFDDGVAHPTATIETSGGDIAPFLANGNLWVLGDGYSLSAIDPESARMFLSAPSGKRPVAAIAARGVIWVANALDHNVVRFDARSDRQVDRPIRLPYRPTALAEANGRIWVALEPL